jgi:hypothetical protein
MVPVELSSPCKEQFKEQVEKVKEGRKKGPEVPNFQEKMDKVAQVLSSLNQPTQEPASRGKQADGVWLVR